MRRVEGFAVVVALAGCSGGGGQGSGTLGLEISGTTPSWFGDVPVALAPADWKGANDFGPVLQWGESAIGGVDDWFSPYWTTTFPLPADVAEQSGLGPDAKVTFYLQTHDIMLLGPIFSGLLVFDDFKGASEYDLSEGSGVAERVRWTGNWKAPLVFSGTIDATVDTLTLHGTYEMPLVCGDKPNSGRNCGTNGIDPNVAAFVTVDDPFVGTWSEGNYQSDCPAEVEATFLDGADYTWNIETMTVGAGQPLDCHVSEGTSGQCGGAVASVQADGCTWTVDAYGSPGTQVWVWGTADASCTREGGRFCVATRWEDAR